MLYKWLQQDMLIAYVCFSSKFYCYPADYIHSYVHTGVAEFKDMSA